MRLSRLTLSGFKSFAKTTTFDFTAASSAIVGPNGSGKSNVAEAIRWVLGEQSMKTLRGKRGEDLIFSGSPKIPRMGKAAVALVFDNRDHAVPIDFEEIEIERKIFRDGTNEYALNGSPARLKDIVEILARLGLGQTHHNIISQGEVDRVLASSPRERRGIFEEAIGLRLWQLKKRDAERKLDETSENTNRVSGLLREISPHLKFLKSQADKAEKREAVRRELENYYHAYMRNESSALAAETGRLESERKSATGRLRAIEADAADLSGTITRLEEDQNGTELIKAREEELRKLETVRRELERQLGRVEGLIEAQPKQPTNRSEEAELGVVEVVASLDPLLKRLEAGAEIKDADELRERLREIARSLSRLLADWRRTVSPSARPPGTDPRLEEERRQIQKRMEEIDRELKDMRSGLEAGIQGMKRAHEDLKSRFERLRERDEEATTLRSIIERITFEEERLSQRRRELERIEGESGLSRGDVEPGRSPFAPLDTDELKRKIEKLRGRLEEIGGIDPSVLNEYQDTQARYEFLDRERRDLAEAEKNLQTLVSELDDRIEHDFQKGFKKISDAFGEYFRTVFGGGSGALAHVIIRNPASSEKEESSGESAEAELGIEIEVDLPRKRIKGLAMLSGGERALVSVALLFAIASVNPPPFLVLDETDAALDEANSQKYGAILKELSKKTQLILITHNRETMKQAGILYGVTMGENGISRILSIKLEEAESYGNR